MTTFTDSEGMVSGSYRRQAMRPDSLRPSLYARVLIYYWRAIVAEYGGCGPSQFCNPFEETMTAPAMKVKFWGVRGSIPAPGAATSRYGGNTSCVSVELPEKKILILDAGTGIRELGKVLAPADSGEIFVLISHPHWDHVQGFPFFLPIYQPDRAIYMFPSRLNDVLMCALVEQMDGANFPVSQAQLPSRLECITEDEMAYLRRRGIEISRVATNHPGGGYGYRVENAGRSLVYLTDNELEPPKGMISDFDTFVEFCRRADVLVHDAQYEEQDMPLKLGWGHSVTSQVCGLAAAAEVKHLVLYHHDPDRLDPQVDEIQAKARRWFQERGYSIRCTAAFEGLALEL